MDADRSRAHRGTAISCCFYSSPSATHALAAPAKATSLPPMHRPDPRTCTLRRRARQAIMPRLLKRRQLEVILQLKFRFRIPFPGLEINDQAIFHREYRVVGDMLVPPIEDLRDDRFIPRRCDNEMDVRGAHRVAIEELEEFPCGTIVGNGV